MINTKYKIQKNTKSIANVPEGGGENLSANRNATTYKKKTMIKKKYKKNC